MQNFSLYIQNVVSKAQTPAFNLIKQLLTVFKLTQIIFLHLHNYKYLYSWHCILQNLLFTML